MPRSLPPISANAAFFIDFDGTLVAIAPRPDLVHVEPLVLHVLKRLNERFDHAVAVITGRPLDAVDGFLAPLKLPVAAEHGSIRRDAEGRVHADTGSIEAVTSVAARLEPSGRGQSRSSARAQADLGGAALPPAAGAWRGVQGCGGEGRRRYQGARRPARQDGLRGAAARARQGDGGAGVPRRAAVQGARPCLYGRRRDGRGRLRRDQRVGWHHHQDRRRQYQSAIPDRPAGLVAWLESLAAQD